jgi:hypothetical protein
MIEQEVLFLRRQYMLERYRALEDFQSFRPRVAPLLQADECDVESVVALMHDEEQRLAESEDRAEIRLGLFEKRECREGIPYLSR